MSWAGWQFAAVVLILRGRHRLAAVTLLAVTLAFSILAGNPQIEVVIFLALGVFAGVILVMRVVPARGGGPGGGGPIRIPILDLLIGCIAAGGLAAPLALPGRLQLASAKIAARTPYASANPVSQVLGTVFQSFWGQPLAGSFINGQGFYVEQWVYVGAIARRARCGCRRYPMAAPRRGSPRRGDGGGCGRQCPPARRRHPQPATSSRSLLVVPSTDFPRLLSGHAWSRRT